MSDQNLQVDPAYLRALTPRDPFAAHLYMRRLRSTMASELLMFFRRHIRQRLKGLSQSAGGREAPRLPEQADVQKEAGHER